MKRKGGASSTAVMARRAAATVETDNDQEALWRRLDFFASPPWAARAGLEHARGLWPDATVLVEPACGQMHIAGPAREYFPEVLPFDVHAHAADTPLRDWLDDRAWPEEPCCDVIITNPPFSLAEEFIVRGLRRARLGVGLLLRLAVLEGVERHALLHGPKATLTQAMVFSERAPMTLGNWDPTASSATAYAWFFWSKVHEPRPLGWFPPGTRERLWLKDDARTYGRMEPLPLFPDDPGIVL